MGSVQSAARLRNIFQSFTVETIYHAAAYKHVPLVEHNIMEGVQNNIFGTETLVRAAINAGVGTLTLISTDKAVRPTNFMGASKRIAEVVCQAYAAEQTALVFPLSDLAMCCGPPVRPAALQGRSGRGR